MKLVKNSKIKADSEVKHDQAARFCSQYLFNEIIFQSKTE